MVASRGGRPDLAQTIYSSGRPSGAEKEWKIMVRVAFSHVPWRRASSWGSYDLVFGLTPGSRDAASWVFLIARCGSCPHDVDLLSCLMVGT